MDVIRLVRTVSSLASLSDDLNSESSKQKVLNIKNSAESFFKDFDFKTDKAIFARMVQEWVSSLDPEFVPSILLDANTKYNGDLNAFTEDLYKNSVIVNQDQLMQLLNNYNEEAAAKLASDQFIELMNNYFSFYNTKVKPKLSDYEAQLEVLDREYMKAQMEMQPKKLFYPDANFSLRLTYGKVDDYKPRNAVQYDYYTTLSGIIEKDNPEIYDYRVPQRLKELYASKDFGQYAFEGDVPVCFIASNHTSGGNSGSPVINANGELIGVNFDRNWEGTMSDIMYDPDQCRNISLDIRYALFIIDKFAGATWLIDEMNIVK